MTPGGLVRALLRACAILACLCAAVVAFAMLWVRSGGEPGLRARARWLHRWCRRVLRLMRIEVAVEGSVPEHGLMVSNHLSYLDILTFSAAAPSVFVAKVEVRSWPLFGMMARLGGTIFTDRRRLRQLPRVLAQAQEALRQGVLLVVFPEATTTDGTLLLPFRPAIFEAAVRSGAPVTSAHICYTVEDEFASELCWWGDVHLMSHVANAFSKKQIGAHVRVWPESHVFADAKTAAATTQAEVLELRAREGKHAPALAGVAPPGSFVLDES